MKTELKTIAAYDEFRSSMTTARDACNFLADMTTTEGYEKSKRVALDGRKIINNVEKKRKELKQKSLDEGRLIDSEAKSIIAEVEEFQLPHQNAYKELDNLKKEQKQRLKGELEERVRVIRELPEAMADSDSDGVKMALESLQVEECLDFYELTAEALKARNASKEALSKMFADKLKQEKDAVELAELRKKQAEQEQKDRDERIAKEASEKAECEAADAKAAEQKAIDQAALAVKQRETAEAQAKVDAEVAEECRVLAEAEAKKNTEAAEAQAKANAEAAAKAATEEAERVQKAKEADELAEQEKREANKRHAKKINNQAVDCFVANGFSKDEAIKIVTLIAKKEVTNIVINY